MGVICDGKDNPYACSMVKANLSTGPLSETKHNQSMALTCGHILSSKCFSGFSKCHRKWLWVRMCRHKSTNPWSSENEVTRVKVAVGGR